MSVITNEPAHFSDATWKSHRPAMPSWHWPDGTPIYNMRFRGDPLTTHPVIRDRQNYYYHVSSIDGVTEYRRFINELRHDVATDNVLKEASNQFHDAIHSDEPYWARYTERRVVAGETVETAHWVPVDIRHERDRINIEHVVTVAMAMIAQVSTLPESDRMIEFVDARNIVHRLREIEALQTLWPVLDWYQKMWSAYQRRKATIRLCLTNRQLRALPPAEWPAVPDGPATTATLATLGVSVATPTGPVEHMAVLPDPHTDDPIRLEVPAGTTGFLVVATTTDTGASIRMDGPATRAFPLADDQANVLVVVFAENSAETAYRLAVVRAEPEEPPDQEQEPGPENPEGG